jgi:FkbM family methyltransferase
MPSSLDAHISETETEWSTIDYFKKVVQFLKSREIKTVLDVGGCTGQVSVMLLHEIPSIEKVTILEPVLENYNFIVDRAKSADSAKVEVLNKALFYGETHIKLGQCDSNVGGWSFKHTGNQTNEVETTTLEDFSDIDFAKIDIEGAELNVIPESTYINDIPYLEVEFHDELMTSWKTFVGKHLKNHKVKFEGNPDRPQNVFLVRKDLY